MGLRPDTTAVVDAGRPSVRSSEHHAGQPPHELVAPARADRDRRREQRPGDDGDDPGTAAVVVVRRGAEEAPDAGGEVRGGVALDATGPAPRGEAGRGQ